MATACMLGRSTTCRVVRRSRVATHHSSSSWSGSGQQQRFCSSLRESVTSKLQFQKNWRSHTRIAAASEDVPPSGSSSSSSSSSSAHQPALGDASPESATTEQNGTTSSTLTEQLISSDAPTTQQAEAQAQPHKQPQTVPDPESQPQAGAAAASETHKPLTDASSSTDAQLTGGNVPSIAAAVLEDLAANAESAAATAIEAALESTASSMPSTTTPTSSTTPSTTTTPTSSTTTTTRSTTTTSNSTTSNSTTSTGGSTRSTGGSSDGGSSPGKPASPSQQAGRSKGLSELKLKLFAKLASLDRGIAANASEAAAVEQLVQQLESCSPPLQLSWSSGGLPELFGTWRLLYSSGFNSGSLGGTRPGPPAAFVPLVLGQVYQRINNQQGFLDNIVEFMFNYNLPQLPFMPSDPETPALRLTLRHTFEVMGTSTVQIVYEGTSAELVGPAAFSSLPKIDAPSPPDFLKPPKSFRSASFEVTYLDSELRVSRGDRGELRVYLKDHESELPFSDYED